MTSYDIAVPLICLSLGVIAVVYVKILNWRLHRYDDLEDQPR